MIQLKCFKYFRLTKTNVGYEAQNMNTLDIDLVIYINKSKPFSKNFAKFSEEFSAMFIKARMASRALYEPEMAQPIEQKVVALRRS